MLTSSITNLKGGECRNADLLEGLFTLYLVSFHFSILLRYLHLLCILLLPEPGDVPVLWCNSKSWSALGPPLKWGNVMHSAWFQIQVVRGSMLAQFSWSEFKVWDEYSCCVVQSLSDQPASVIKWTDSLCVVASSWKSTSETHLYVK